MATNSGLSSRSAVTLDDMALGLDIVAVDAVAVAAERNILLPDCNNDGTSAGSAGLLLRLMCIVLDDSVCVFGPDTNVFRSYTQHEN